MQQNTGAVPEGLKIMQNSSLISIVLEALGAIAPDADLQAVTADVSFHDQFGLDSIDFLRMMLDLERRLGVQIPDVDYPQLSTLNGCVEYLQVQLPGKSASWAA